MMSHPSYGERCRPLQFPDLDALNYACQTAMALCSHLVIFRESFAVIKSTTQHAFEGVATQMKIMPSCRHRF
jgi:hypothetical protein